MFCPTPQRENFSQGDWTTQISLNCFRKLLFMRRRLRRFLCYRGILWLTPQGQLMVNAPFRFYPNWRAHSAHSGDDCTGVQELIWLDQRLDSAEKVVEKVVVATLAQAGLEVDLSTL